MKYILIKISRISAIFFFYIVRDIIPLTKAVNKTDVNDSKLYLLRNIFSRTHNTVV